MLAETGKRVFIAASNETARKQGVDRNRCEVKPTRVLNN
jgi:hypothetical protein